MIRKLLTPIMLLACITVYSQKTLHQLDPSATYKTGVELFEKQKYSAARHLFEKVTSNPSFDQTEIKANSQYYEALCALELFNADAEYLLAVFINENPENAKQNEARFHMGRFHYNNKKYSKASEWFAQVKPDALTEDQRHEFYFQSGYCYFQEGDFEKARVAFSEIKDIDTKYTSPALYYYSHILYIQKNYESALAGFLRLKDDETFSPIVPYYISQIYFLQKKYDKVVEYAPALLDSVTEKRMAEMSRIIGESYFKLNKYGEAIPFLEKYMEKANAPTQDDKYELAYSYYRTGDYKNAVKYFEQISSADNSVAQNALYHLADCYIRLKDKNKARMAFSSASKMNYNEDIKESALFNYAIVTYELSYSPFNEAVRAFEDYIKAFPNSKRSDEAYNYLALAYSSTKNYKAALESIEKIRNKDNTIKKAYQRIAFFRGLEIYNSLKFEDALGLFDKSLSNAQYDRILTARAYYWKGESYYRLGDYENAAQNYNTFLNSSGAPTLEEFETANYNIAYCYFNQKKYNDALTWFKRYTSVLKDARTNTVGDSYNRIGDCYFMSSTYWTAAENYDKAIAIAKSDIDYAMFQKGFTLGLVNRPERKIETLSQLLKTYPASAYTDDAMYEMGRSYVTMEKPDMAISMYNRLLKEYPNSSYVPKTLLALGLINYNRDKDTEAIAFYKKVISDYPGTNDARDALAGLKNVYTGTNDAQGYISYVETLGTFANVRESEQDSMFYRAAENMYMQNNCEKASQNFNSYLERFPQGSFVTNARFYLADCSRLQNKSDEAIKGYEYVLAQPHNMFTEQALVNAAYIYYNQGNFQSALTTYKRLIQEGEINTNITDAKVGAMRCNFKLNDYVATIYSAADVMKTEKVPAELQREIRYMVGRSHFETGNKVAALDEFKILSKDVKSVEGAEAKYMVAEILYSQGKKDAAEKEILDFIDKNTPHQFWLGKSFILLSDIYVDRKDDFQAYQTLKSIVDYYEVKDDGILAIASEKQSKILAKNPNVENIGQQPELEIDMNKKQIK